MGDLSFAGFLSIIIALGLWYYYSRSRSKADSKLDKFKSARVVKVEGKDSLLEPK
jgi:hypothetical protein